MRWEESMATERTANREAILAEQDEAEWLAGERATEQETEELRRKTNRTEENKEHENGLRAVLNRATATACQKLEEAAETRRPDTITKWEKTGRKSITWRKRRKARYARTAVLMLFLSLSLSQTAKISLTAGKKRKMSEEQQEEQVGAAEIYGRTGQ